MAVETETEEQVEIDNATAPAPAPTEVKSPEEIARERDAHQAKNLEEQFGDEFDAKYEAERAKKPAAAAPAWTAEDHLAQFNIGPGISRQQQAASGRMVLTEAEWREREARKAAGITDEQPERQHPATAFSKPPKTDMGQALDEKGTGLIERLHANAKGHHQASKAAPGKYAGQKALLQDKLTELHDKHDKLEHDLDSTSAWRIFKRAGLKEEMKLNEKLEQIEAKKLTKLNNSIGREQTKEEAIAVAVAVAAGSLEIADKGLHALGSAARSVGGYLKGLGVKGGEKITEHAKSNADDSPSLNAAHAFLGQGANGDRDLAYNEKAAPPPVVEAPIQNAAYAFLGQGNNGNHDLKYNAKEQQTAEPSAESKSFGQLAKDAVAKLGNSVRPGTVPEVMSAPTGGKAKQTGKILNLG